MRRTTILIWGFLSFLAGLGLARIWPGVPFWWVLPLLLAMFVYRRKRFLVVLVILLGVVLGLWRAGQVMQQLVPYRQLARRPVVVRVRATQDAVYGERRQLTFDGDHVTVVEPHHLKLPGKLKVQGFGAPQVDRGDVVEVRGSLFPTRGSRQGTISFAELRVVTKSASPIETIRKKFVAGTETALPEPYASFALGLLIGQRTTLPDDVSDALAAVGLTHIIAVSGYNLTIIVRAIQRLGRRRSKYQITVLSVTLMLIFVLITGLSASIVRAALVSGLSLWAWYYGRAFRPVLLLVLVAALTAGWNPLYLWSDVGWHLSFLAFYGVLVLVPLAVRRWHRHRSPPALLLVVFETTAAQLMTMPLIMYIFGQTSPLAVVSNVLVVPLVPLAMLLSLLAGLAGMLVPVTSGWLAWPGQVLLRYMLDITALLAQLPHALLKASLPLGAMLAVYAIIVAVSVVLGRRRPAATDELTP